MLFAANVNVDCECSVCEHNVSISCDCDKCLYDEGGSQIGCDCSTCGATITIKCRCGHTSNSNAKAFTPKVTEVVNVNAMIADCYYRPKINEIPNLQQRIEKEGNFIVAYTGFWDLKIAELQLPQSQFARELSILGYDYLYQNETVVIKENSEIEVSFEKTPTDNIALQTSLMNIYKALGEEQLEYYITYQPNEKFDSEKHPAMLHLPGNIQGVDKSQAITKVFISRTAPQKYLDQAVKDLIIAEDVDKMQSVYGRDFIVYLADLMHLYGEPVLSQLEMNQLLQVYGADVPAYLTPREKDAYLYLKARGVLNVELDYNEPIQLDSMLSILMCVKDENSRTNFKEIQLVMNTDRELQDKGYFPKQITLATNEAGVYVDTEYDYTTATKLDYYVLIDENTTFRDAYGNIVRTPFVPENPEIVSAPYKGSIYNGIVDNKYYHFTVPIEYEYDMVTINTPMGDDTPRTLKLPVGGGVYHYQTMNDGSVVCERRPFQTLEFQGAVDSERIGDSRSKWDGALGFLQLFSPMPAYAATNQNSTVGNGVSNTVTVNNAKYITNLPDLKSKFKVIKEDLENGIIVFGTAGAEKDALLAAIERSSSPVDATSNVTNHLGYATLTGNTLVPYDDLVERGLFNGPPGIPEGDVLTLYSSYGQVRMNQKTHEIVVGSVLYKVPENTQLFYYVIVDGASKLYVDFRVAYGWGGNYIKVEFTGTGKESAVNIKPVDTFIFTQINIQQVWGYESTFKSDVMKETEEHDVRKLVMSRSYPLSNWIVFQGTDDRTGLGVDYLFTYYLTSAFTKGAPDDSSIMQDVVGYSAKASNWALKAFKLTNKTTNEPGKISYEPGVGYVYNVPTTETFTMEGYLKGDFMLPLSFDTTSKRILNHNVNKFSGYEYGVAPYAKTKLVDYKGNQKEANTEVPALFEIEPAPVAVSILAGSSPKSFIEIKDINYKEQTKNMFHFGSMKTELVKEGDTYSLKVLENPMSTGSYNYRLEGSEKLYCANIGKDGRALYVYTGDTGTITHKTNEEDKDTFSPVIIDGERDDKFNFFEEFSLEYVLNNLNDFATLVIALSIYVLPLIGIGAVTILFGLSFLSDNQLVHAVCAKTIDPVRVLTLGRYTIQQWNFKDSFVSLMLLYIVFALALDGNLLRIISWLLEWYDTFVKTIT